MTTEESDNGPDMARLNANLEKIEALSQRLAVAFGKKKPGNPSLEGPGQELYAKAASAYLAQMMADPGKVFEQQISLWGEALQEFVKEQQLLASDTPATSEKSGLQDKRFSNPHWDSNPYFKLVKQQYLFGAQSMQNAVSGIEGLEPQEKKRLAFFTGQIVDLLSPANFLGTNPEALARAAQTDGQSLVDGLENLVRDLEANDGELVVSLADKAAFKVGENLATSKGAVIFRNRMFELIQYAPSTETVHKTPLIIFPPWINKFYILDLKEKNSLIKWIVDQGITLFVVSWVNPDPGFADVGMDQYVQEGFLCAIEEVKKITGEKKVNVVGYCIAGATLALTLSLMKKRADRSVKSATFFTTLTDFSDQGEVGVFLDNDFVDGIEQEVNQKGILNSFFMSRTFSYLRSNDLIYAPAIRNYMMGQPPPAFDLLYWNGDGTNLPARMAIQYLRGLCQDNLFARGEFVLLGEKLRLKDVSVPLCAIACETDHIAAWRASYDGIAQMKSPDKTFVLSQSGHVAGIVNPPSREKYGHFTSPELSLDHDAWKAGADFTKGSWWPRWGAWLAKRSGKQIPARQPGDASHKVLCKAPGTYVLVQSDP